MERRSMVCIRRTMVDRTSQGRYHFFEAADNIMMQDWLLLISHCWMSNLFVEVVGLAIVGLFCCYAVVFVCLLVHEKISSNAV